MMQLITLVLIVVAVAAIPAAIVYCVVKITTVERTGDYRDLFKYLFTTALKIGSALAFVGAAVFVSAMGAFDGTNVAFQSSDGEWADSEILFKGRDFEGILFRFELYKAKCSPYAKLQRTTQKPNWFEYDNLFNDYSSPKWNVPYAPALPNAKNGSYPPVSVNSCANSGSTVEETKAASEHARQVMLGFSH